MMERLMEWWAGLSRPQQLILGLGVPLAGGAALVANLRDRSASPDGDGEGSEDLGPSTPIPDFEPDNTDLLIALEASRHIARRDLERALSETEARIRNDLSAGNGGGGGGGEDGPTNDERFGHLEGEIGWDPETSRMVSRPGIRPTGEAGAS